MPQGASPQTSEPQLSIHIWTFSAEDPGGWGHVLDQAVAADQAGVDRVVVSDHVVFGEHLEAYGRPDSTSTTAAGCSTSRWPSARRCGASHERRSTATICGSRPST